MSDPVQVCRARIAQLLGLDPLKPVVSGTTLTALAREFAAGQAREDGDVLAERNACIRVMTAALARLRECETLDDVCTEMRRLGEGIGSVELGLHRLDGKEKTSGI